MDNFMVHHRYETDFYTWALEQAELLRHQQWEQLDVPNLVEEIVALGKQQRHDLRNRLSVLIGYLLKWQFQPERRTRSWLATIRAHRKDLNLLLEENLSLKPYLQRFMPQAYSKGIDLVVSQTNLPFGLFPATCPYRLVEILSDRFYPGIPSPELEVES